MSYTTLNGIPYGVPQDVLGLLREGMIGELVAIREYDYHIRNSEIPELTEILKHIRDEEVEHYYIFLDLLRKYDKEQMKEMKKAKEHANFLQPHPMNHEKNSTECILNMLRNDIKGELEAINLYEFHVLKIKNKEIRDAFNKIIKDEKHHVEELTDAIEKLTY